MQEKWWTKPIRAVTLELPAADIKTLDVRKIVRTLATYDVNMINAFAISYWPGGVAYYQSRIAPKHPDLGSQDLLAEVIDEAHNHGIKVVAYVNCLWGNRDMYEKHPEWAQRRVDEKPTTWEPTHTATAMCPNSPYRDYLLDIVGEISDSYNVDGFYFDEPSFQSWCNCASCKNRFEERFNRKLPREADWTDALWQKFIQWRYNCITNFKKALYDKSKKNNRVIFFQHPFPLAFFSYEQFMTLAEILRKKPETMAHFAGMQDTRWAGLLQMVRWQVPQIYGAKLQDVAEFEDMIHFELYRRGVQKPLWWYGICARLGHSAGQGKPVLVLNMQGYSPFDLISLPEAELRLAIGEIVANNAQPLFAMYYPTIADRRGWEIVGKVFRELRECNEYLADLESTKYAAVLYSQKTTDLFDSDAKETRHVDCLMGICKALLQEHLLFDVITEKQLKELQNYKVLILPDVRCMNEDEGKTIENFVKNGGGLIATYKTSLYDKRGNAQTEMGLSDVLGTNYLGHEKEVFSYDSYMQIKEAHPVTRDLSKLALIPSMGTQLTIRTSGEAKNLSTLIEEPRVHYAPLNEDSGIPTITVNQYGKGRVVYFAGPIGDRFLKFGLPDHRRLIAQAVMWATNCPMPVRVDNCPDTVELTAFKQTHKGRFILQLVNSIRSQIQEPITHVSCEHDVRVDIQVLEKQPNYKVMVLPDKIELPCEEKNGYISFKIPEIRYHKIVVVEKIEKRSGRDDWKPT